MQISSWVNTVFGIIVLTSCYEVPMRAESFTYRRTNTKQLTLETDEKLDSKLEVDTTELPTKFIEKLNGNIETLESSESSSELDLEAMEDLNADASKTRRHATRIYSIRQLEKIKANRNRPITVHAILDSPTNVMRAYLRSKTGLYLKMNDKGELSGTEKMSDKHVVFIIERMSRDAVRLKAEAANKYICINKKRRIVTREKPISKCLLRNYLEENHYELFWSYLYSNKEDGENGWFLALRRNGKIRKPSKTRLGDKQTMFYVHRINDNDPYHKKQS